MFFIKIGVAETRHCQIVEFEGFSVDRELCGLNLVIILLDAVEQFGFGDDESTKCSKE
jgi:hypothetical protein